MVGTRRSLLAPSSDDREEHEDAGDNARAQSPPADTTSEHDKRVKSALRKLEIDGTAALLGHRASRQQGPTIGTYHYRGAVYDITADTPQEWIDQQPMRYRHSESESVRHGTSSARAKAPKRKLSEMRECEEAEQELMHEQQQEHVEEDNRTEEPPTKRRRRQSAMESQSSPAAKRETRTSAMLNPSPCRTRSSAAPAVRSEPRKATKQSSIPDTQRQSGPLSSPTAARAIAKNKRQQVEALHESEAQMKTEEPDTIMGRSKTMGKKKQDAEDLKHGNELQDQAADARHYHAMRVVMKKLGVVNSRFYALSKRYRQLRACGEFDSLLNPDLATLTLKKEDHVFAVGNGDPKALSARIAQSRAAETALHAYASPVSLPDQQPTGYQFPRICTPPDAQTAQPNSGRKPSLSEDTTRALPEQQLQPGSSPPLGSDEDTRSHQIGETPDAQLMPSSPPPPPPNDVLGAPGDNDDCNDNDYDDVDDGNETDRPAHEEEDEHDDDDDDDNDIFHDARAHAHTSTPPKPPPGPALLDGACDLPLLPHAQLEPGAPSSPSAFTSPPSPPPPPPTASVPALSHLPLPQAQTCSAQQHPHLHLAAPALADDGRAEHAIYRGRATCTESAQARRRRVRGELALLRAWPVIVAAAATAASVADRSSPATTPPPPPRRRSLARGDQRRDSLRLRSGTARGEKVLYS